MTRNAIIVIRLRMLTPSCVGYPIDTEWLITVGSMGHQLSTMTPLGNRHPIGVIGNFRLWMGSTLEAERGHTLAPKHTLTRPCARGAIL